MIDMLQGRNSWLLAQICIGHLQPSKKHYLALADLPAAGSDQAA
jgi:hypothetical protein